MFASLLPCILVASVKEAQAFSCHYRHISKISIVIYTLRPGSFLCEGTKPHVSQLTLYAAVEDGGPGWLISAHILNETVIKLKMGVNRERADTSWHELTHPHTAQTSLTIINRDIRWNIPVLSFSQEILQDSRQILGSEKRHVFGLDGKIWEFSVFLWACF